MASNTNQSAHQYLDGQFDSQLSRQLVLSVPVTLSKRLLVIHVLSTLQSLRKSEKTADYVVPTTDHYIMLVMSIAYNISKLCTQIVNNRYKCFSAWQTIIALKGNIIKEKQKMYRIWIKFKIL